MNEIIQAAMPCDECKALMKPDHAWAYCPHNQSLVLADLDNNRFVAYGPLTSKEADEVINQGIKDGVARFKSDIVFH